MTNPEVKSVRTICYICLICLLAAAWGYHRKRDDVPANLVHSSDAADRAIDRSVPICRAMARPGERLKLTAEYQDQGRFPSRWAVWAVDCAGEDEGVVTHLLWNAATGQLQAVSAEMPLPSASRHTSLISERTALVDARRWLRIAALDVPGSHWRFGHPAHPAAGYGTYWTVVASSSGSRLTFHLNGSTGGLLGFSISKQ